MGPSRPASFSRRLYDARLLPGDVVRVEPSESPRQRRPRRRDERHLAYLRGLPCAVRGCSAGPIHAAHIRAPALAWGKRPTGLQEKPDDRWAVPLCAHHHLAGQHVENEVAWWAKQGINPFGLAAALYDATGDLEAGALIVRGKLSAAIPF